MTTTEAEATRVTEAPRGESQWGLLWRRLRRKRLAMISLVIVAIIYAAGLLAPFVAPYSFTQQNLDRQLEGPSRDHLLGTDRLGRDMLSRAIYSARTTLIVTTAVLLTGSLVIGNALGLLAGYKGGWIDNLIMRVGEIFAGLPALVMLILINTTLSPRAIHAVRWIEDHTPLTGLVSSGLPSYLVVFGALSLFFWIGTARLIRSQVLQLRERDFIAAAESLGARSGRVIFRHLLPNVSFLIVLEVSSTLGAIAGSEIFLTWFGVGVQPPTPSFGAMLFDGSGARTFQAHPHLLLVPGVIVTMLLYAFVLLGDALNDAIAGR
ncbi:MAG: ABC transporter permease [Chloroflexi bacterium]|nr:ABC transporter permease [Chloroflexota bacterium]